MNYLTTLHQWLPVLLVWDATKNKYNKLPCDSRTGMPADAHNPAHWTTYEQARATATTLGPTYTVGFVLTAADDLFCVDIDHARTATGWSPLANEMAAALPGCYIETSVSGNGLHVWGRYPSPPPHRKKRTDLDVECYTEGRFIAIGTPLMGDMADRCDAFPQFIANYFALPPGANHEVPDEGPREDWRGPTDDAELLRRAMRSRSAAAAFNPNHAAFADLWVADEAALARAYPKKDDVYDRSAADMALASHLAFWTGCDVARIERLMRQSALAREKWDARDDYLVGRTIMGACAGRKDVLCDPLPQPGPAAVPPGAPPAPATPIPVEGSTFLSPADQATLFAGCIYIRDMHRILVPGGALLTPDKFRSTYGGYTFSMDTRNERTTRNAWEAFTESQALRMPRAETVCFKPSLPYGVIIEQGGVTMANSYSAPRVDRRPGDVEPFLRHLRLLVPDEYERKCVFYTLCALVQRQGYKAQYALVLQGTEGNGKSFLAKCVAKAVGEKHVHYPRADKIAAGFNGWLRGHTLYVVEEIMVGDRQDIVDILKTMITADSGIEIEQKGVDQVTAEICGNFICTTNHRHALRKTANDRRWFVVYTAQQSRADLERDGMLGSYMNDLHEWGRRGGHAAVAELLWATPIPSEFDFSQGMQRAPVTVSTASVIAATQGAVEQEITDAVERAEIGFRGGWISSHYLDGLLKRIGRDRSIPINRRREVLQELGYDWHPALTQGRTNNMVLPDGVKSRLFVHAERADLRSLSAADAARRYCQDQGAA